MKIYKKINSNKGASILLALMLFFVCFMVASVILSSATANIDKIRQRDENQKEYLSVGSAANLLRNIFGGVEYKGWETNTVYECFGELLQIRPERHSDIAELCTEMNYDKGVEARLRAELQGMVYEAFTSHTQYVTPKPVSAVITKEFVIKGTGMKDVKLKMSLDRDSYLLTCSLTLNDSTDVNNAMTVTFKAGVNAQNKDSADVLIKPDVDSHEVQIEIDDDGIRSKVWVPKTYDVTVYTINTRIAYDAGTVSKGVYP